MCLRGWGNSPPEERTDAVTVVESTGDAVVGGRVEAARDIADGSTGVKKPEIF